ncbi:hypothetical protein [Lysobacter arvi]|uniref:Uncharacterized protein n=1 Tax=Lysobacter arvi TaxID=3038776 RepID=A0ABU1CDC5_9GAMM|nr:hypothetical protein [Lysobacter arvi]MDR0182409.1 hypothetical protein [Lysobacter arvi]
MRHTILLPSGTSAARSSPHTVKKNERRTYSLFVESGDMPLDAHVALCIATPGADTTMTHLTQASPIAQIEGELDVIAVRQARTGAPLGVFVQEEFAPAQLIAGGTVGAWFDPSDMSTLFQDAAGTIPVTRVGQPVGKVLDKSGCGWHLTQATATRRPVLQQDARGRRYLKFDEIDDALTTPAQVLSGGTHLFAVGAKITHPSPWGTYCRIVFGAVEKLYFAKSGTRNRFEFILANADAAGQWATPVGSGSAFPGIDDTIHVAVGTVNDGTITCQLNRAKNSRKLLGSGNFSETTAIALGPGMEFYGAMYMRGDQAISEALIENAARTIAEMTGTTL